MKFIDTTQTAGHGLCLDLPRSISDAPEASASMKDTSSELEMPRRSWLEKREAPHSHVPHGEGGAAARVSVELEEAVSLITGALSPLETEEMPLAGALGRTVASTVTALVDQPPFNRSPLDGYALRAADSVSACREHPVRLWVTDTVFAGDVAGVPVLPGQAVRVMTGAMLPAGCDCVLRQEDTDEGHPMVSIYAPLRPHENYVDRGEDFRAGTPLLHAGTRLDAAALGLLASAGFCSVMVKRRPVAALLTTGDEVVSPGAFPLPEGKIYNSHAALFSARLEELGFARPVVEHAGDNPEMAARAMARLLERADVLFTTGGVSVGSKDILHQALPLLGAEQVFWKVRFKPGTPALFSRWRGKPILSLSGNPFAAAATFELLGRPLLAALSGEPGTCSLRASGVLNTPFSKASSGRRFVRGRYADGQITLPERHSSGMLASLVGCNCLLDIPAGSGPLNAGRNVSVWML